MAGCQAEVSAILRSRSSDPAAVSRSEVTRRLAQLPDGCRDEIRAAGRDLLARLPETNEGDFAAVLDALALLSDADADELASAAIENPHALVKEDYVSVLEDLDEADRAIAALLAVLEDGVSQPGRPDLSTTIRALHALQDEDALSSVARYLDHPDVAVRGAAAMFLYDFDDSGSLGAPAFTQRLVQENNPAMLELLIDGLRRWKVRPSQQLLDRLAADDSLPDSLRESVRLARAMDVG